VNKRDVEKVTADAVHRGAEHGSAEAVQRFRDAESQDLDKKSRSPFPQ
jgi:hypothetical protein